MLFLSIALFCQHLRGVICIFSMLPTSPIAVASVQPHTCVCNIHSPVQCPGPMRCYVFPGSTSPARKKTMILSCPSNSGRQNYIKFHGTDIHKTAQTWGEFRKKMKKSETQNAKKKQTNPRRPQQSWAERRKSKISEKPRTMLSGPDKNGTMRLCWEMRKVEANREERRTSETTCAELTRVEHERFLFTISCHCFRMKIREEISFHAPNASVLKEVSWKSRFHNPTLHFAIGKSRTIGSCSTYTLWNKCHTKMRYFLHFVFTDSSSRLKFLLFVFSVA